VVREGVGAGGRNDQALYAHMNNKTIKKKNYTIFFMTDHMLIYRKAALTQKDQNKQSIILCP
jgi:hypothetical protein